MPKSIVIATVVACACTLAALPAGAEAPSRAHPVADYCDLESWVSMGSFALIRMNESSYEERLWRSDGTVAGTYPLTMAMPVSDSDDGTKGWQLWAVD